MKATRRLGPSLLPFTLISCQTVGNMCNLPSPPTAAACTLRLDTTTKNGTPDQRGSAIISAVAINYPGNSPLCWVAFLAILPASLLAIRAHWPGGNSNFTVKASTSSTHEILQ